MDNPGFLSRFVDRKAMVLDIESSHRDVRDPQKICSAFDVEQSWPIGRDIVKNHGKNMEKSRIQSMAEKETNEN